MFYFAMSLVILAGLFYHIFQKSIDTNANPLLSLIATYCVALVASLALLPFFPLNNHLAVEIKQLSWVSYALGLAVVGLEIGFLLAYRTGWNISTGAVFANTAGALLLIPIGIIWFRESVTASNLIGIVLCILGLILIRQR
ncbi:MAG: hypothetical protein GY862_24525 [Gammaproteobacteria bacterium]|nr:hypothetical protein [Gammaproteobacteria bacterium]